MSKPDQTQKLKEEIEHLQSRLQELEETVGSVCGGSADTITVSTVDGEKVFTLKTSEQPYRLFVEHMNQGAILLSEDGMILYCNQAFAGMVKDAAEIVVGKKIQDYVSEDCRRDLKELLKKSWKENKSREHIFPLQAADGKLAKTLFSVAQIRQDDIKAACVVVIDLTAKI